MKFCQCNNYEHDKYNYDCPHNQEMNFVIFTRTISENFSLDGAQRWSDSDIINFMIEDSKVSDMIIQLISSRFDEFCKDFTIEDIVDWEERVINKKKDPAWFLKGNSPIPPYDPTYHGD